MKSIAIRYFTFILGLFFLSMGVDFIVTSALGTTPISSINYVLSLNFPITLGTATLLFNLVIIALEFWLVRGKNNRKDIFEILLQIPFSILFSIFIDLNLIWISGLEPGNYPGALTLLAIGCLMQAIGVVLELKPNVAIMSAEGFVKYYCKRYNCNFGKVKVYFDVSLVVTAVLLSLIFASGIQGVREGTVIAALSTGILVNWLSKHLMTRNTLSLFLYPFMHLQGKAFPQKPKLF